MIHVVGIGLDGEVGLSENVRQIVSQASLLIGSDRHLSYFPQHPAQKMRLELTDAIATLRQQIAQDRTTVVLVSGDPLFFGLGRLLLAELPAEKLVFHPHLSSVQLAFSRVKVSWHDAQIVSVHGRNCEELIQVLQQKVEKIALLTDNINTPSAIARLIESLDLACQYQFWVCENLGAPTEQVRSFALADVPAQTAPLNVVILLRQSDPDRLDLTKLPQFGLADHLFISFRDRPGLMTKREVRILVLGELALQPGQIIWDIGAGTGSVSIEIARLFPTSTVYAIEKTAAGISLIQQNCQRFQVENVISIHGSAPEVLAQLPAPNRVFIGGSGGNLGQILAAARVGDGVIVIALATLEHLHTALDWLKHQSWQHQILQVQLARSVPIAKLTRFVPLNPVTLVVAQKEPLG